MLFRLEITRWRLGRRCSGYVNRPEDAEINLSLAKLEANSGNLPDAVHFYQNALYGQ